MEHLCVTKPYNTSMRSRRDMLAASSIALTTTIAGCGRFAADEGDGSTSGFKEGFVQLPAEAELVARAEGTKERDGIRITATGEAYERSEPHNLFLYVRYQIRNRVDTEWEHTGFDETHDWSDSDLSDRVVNHVSNFTPLPEAEADGRRKVSGSQHSVHWSISLDPSRDEPTTYEFVTETAEPSTPTEGDTVATSRGTPSYEFNGSEAEQSIELTYEYGDIE